MTQRFESKRDPWLMGLLFVVMIVIAASLPPALTMPMNELQRVVAVAVPVLSIVLILWLAFGTFYVVGEGMLLIRSGPFRWRIALDDIEDVTPTRAAWSSPALSLDRLRIAYGDGRWVLVSPLERERFIAAVTRGRQA